MRNHSLTLTASHIIRFYLWDTLQTYMEDVWLPLERASGGKVPAIIPVQEQPEVQTSGNPYFTYVYDTNATGDLYHLKTETLTLRLFSQSPATIAATGKLISRTLNQYDDTAIAINSWMRKDGTPGDSGSLRGYLPAEWMDEANAIIFRSVNVAGIQGAQPADDQAGRIDSIISVEMTYVENEVPLDSDNNEAL